jgi:hypothetical protein
MDCVVTGRAKALGNYVPLEFAEPEERPGREPVEKRGTAKRDPGRIEDIEIIRECQARLELYPVPGMRGSGSRDVQPPVHIPDRVRGAGGEGSILRSMVTSAA